MAQTAGPGVCPNLGNWRLHSDGTSPWEYAAPCAAADEEVRQTMSHRNLRHSIDRRTILKAATGAAVFSGWGVHGKSYQRALAQDGTLARILSIPGAGARLTEDDMEQVGALCLQSTRRGAFAGQTVTFLGLNSAGSHSTVFRPLSRAWEEFTGATIHWLDVPQDELFTKIQQGIATGEVEFDLMEGCAPWEGDILGRDLADAMPDWVKDRIDLADYVKLAHPPVGSWDGVTYRVATDADCHTLIYRANIYSDRDFAAEWAASGGEGEWGVPTSWQRVQAQTEFLSGKQFEGAEVYGYLDVIKPGSGFSWYFYASRATAYAKHPESPAWLFDPATMAPYLNNPAFRRGLQDIVDVIDVEPPDQTEADLLTTLGQILGGVGAMTAWWGDISSIVFATDAPEVQDTLRFSVLPGSPEVYNNATNDWDRVGDGRLNFAPNEAFIGWGLYVMRNAVERGLSEAAWDLAAHLGGTDISTWMAVYPSGFQAYRNSQFQPEYWTSAGYPREFAAAYLMAQSRSLNHPNAAIEPRIPGLFEYYVAAEEEMALAVAGEQSVPDALDSAAARWEEITDRNGRESQISLYQAALGA